MHNAVIAGYSRSPFTISYKGELKSFRPEDILAQVINKLISPSNLNKNDIEDVIIGCAFPEGEQGFNIGKVLYYYNTIKSLAIAFRSAISWNGNRY